ncbi:hypothetical protein [Pseudonocardia lacus]|uniref:hypothetical protein n=1 Tax=Pseudonocardia lacus TaxID=2835865 RepID=UPI001BDD65AD|nr:hypothetical protein [Pseudonocardia lacus]
MTTTAIATTIRALVAPLVLVLLGLPGCAGAAAGEGELVAFEALGTPFPGGAGFDELGDGLDPGFAGPLTAYPTAAAALRRPVPAGARTFAFVLVGCQDTTAVLHVRPDRISAEATGPDEVDCGAPEFFFAAFDVPADRVPPGAVLGW